MEDFERKRLSFLQALEVSPRQRPHFERMYTIRIKAGQARILRELGMFGDHGCRFFNPHWVTVLRTSGDANQLGSIIRYAVSFPKLTFRMVLEKIISDRFLMYRIQDGFARDGIFVFGIDPIGQDVCSLSIYVAFDFPRGKNALKGLLWRLFQLLFPGYVHDVIWNHALCQLKHIIESDREEPAVPAGHFSHFSEPG